MNSSNKNNDGWWLRVGKYGAGGNGPESVKNIRKTAFGVMIPLAISLAAIGIGTKACKLWIGKFFQGKNTSATTDNPQEASPIDEEKLAKEEDLRVKNEICKVLGLFNPDPPQPTSLNTIIEDCDTTGKPQPLVGTLIKRGDRVVVVSTPGVGKSLYCWDIAKNIAEGESPKCLPPNSDHAAPQKVYIYDGELDDDDIKQRYGRRRYSDNLVRFPASKFRTCYHLLRHILNITMNHDDDCTLVLDNLFALMPSMSNENTRLFLDGLDAIQRKALEKGHRVTIIIITHTVKDVYGIPRLKDVAGSANISRFAKSELSLVALPDNTNRVAVITNKKRYSDHKDAYIMELKNDDYLHFEYIATVSDSDIESLFHNTVQNGTVKAYKTSAYTSSGKFRPDQIQKMLELRNQGYSDRQISVMTGVSQPTVAKLIGSNGKGHHHGGRKAHKR